MDNRKALDASAISIMTVLCMIWGLQQVALKAAAHDITPLLQIALRSGIAAILVWLLMSLRGQRLQFNDGYWRAGLVVGGLFALEFLLLGEALRFTSASHAVVLLYTAPIFIALGLHWKLPSERLSLMQWCGIALAFVGIVVTFLGNSPSNHSNDLISDMLWGDFLALLAGIAWGATTVIIRLSNLSEAPATQTLLYQLLGGFILLILAALLLKQVHIIASPMMLGSLLFQALIVSFASYLLWFWLLKKYLASRLGVFSFLTPLFGMLFGVWLLNEPLEQNFIIGTLLVLIGVGIVSSYRWFNPKLALRE